MTTPVRTNRPALPFTIELVVGDPSSDGHGKVERILVRTNRSADQIRDAFKRGVEIIGVNLKNLFNEFEESYLPEDAWQKFVAAGIADFGWGPDGDEDGFRLEPDSYADLFLFTITKGDSSFQYEYVMPDALLKIGGYGLFTH